MSREERYALIDEEEECPYENECGSHKLMRKSNHAEYKFGDEEKLQQLWMMMYSKEEGGMTKAEIRHVLLMEFDAADKEAVKRTKNMFHEMSGEKELDRLLKQGIEDGTFIKL
jgi:hypothetical protein